MKVSHNWLQTYFDKPIPSADALAELFTFHSFEVERVERLRDSTYRLTDTVIDAKVLPDRAHYCLSHLGMAEEVFFLTKQPMKSNRSSKSILVSLDVKPTIKIEDPHFCRRYMARYIELNAGKPLTAAQSFSQQMRSFLEAIGQRAISPIVDATNFVMFDVGQPLHAFDADKVKGAIVVRAAKKGEKIELLDSSEGPGKEIELLASDHVIADDIGPLAIAGVKGGKRAGITPSTKHIIIESANFDPTAVRRTATRLDLRSESSKRYENEITPELASPGMNDVSILISQGYPNAKFGPIVDQYPFKAVRTMITFDPILVEMRLGIRIPPREVKDILERMTIAIADEDGTGKWRLTIPFTRLDLKIPEDIVEEVGRIYGYGHIPGLLPPVSKAKVPVLPMYYLSEMIKNVLVEWGFSEVSLYSLVAKGEVETAYPLARDKAFARANLTDGMMACVEKNALNADLLGLDSIKVFEIGRVFSKDGESTHLSIGLNKLRKYKNMDEWEKDLQISIKEIFTNLMNQLGIDSKSIEDGIHRLEIFSNGKRLGQSFSQVAVDTYIIDNGRISIWRVRGGVLEINLDELLKSYKAPSNALYSDLHFGPASPNMYRKISPYPFIVRDIAVFVPESIQADVVWQAIEKGIANASASGLLARHSLFDTFKKDDKVSYAFRIVFQSMDKTLTDDEVNKIMEKINIEMKGKGWEVR
jgi:phenylalanyl-tRNA synthetase beta chain